MRYNVCRMATLRFSFGTMGSGKCTLALQIHHNLNDRGLKGLLLTKLDRDGSQVTSRLGVAAPAVEVTPDLDIHALRSTVAATTWSATRRSSTRWSSASSSPMWSTTRGRRVRVRSHHRLPRPVVRRHEAIARDRRRPGPLQVEARCWCGDRATHNARLVNGEIVYQGEVVVVGDTSVTASTAVR